jgi:hypothetical protein
VKMTDTRDVMIVLLGSVLLRMEMDKLTVGQAADLLIKLLDREGYKIEKKK